MKRLLSCVLVLVLFCGCAASFEQQRKSSRPMVNLGISKMQQDNMQGALIELRKAREANPKDPEVYYYLSQVYLRMNEPERALDEVNRAIRYGDRIGMEHPGMKSEAYNLKGYILVIEQKQTEALECFQKALEDELYATPEYARYNMANVYLVQGRYAEAEEALQKALERNIGYAQAWNSLGRLYQEQGRYEQALEAYGHALKSVPEYTEVHWELALLLHKLGRADQAREHYAEVVKLDPEGRFGMLARQRMNQLKPAVRER